MMDFYAKSRGLHITITVISGMGGVSIMWLLAEGEGLGVRFVCMFIRIVCRYRGQCICNFVGVCVWSLWFFLPTYSLPGTSHSCTLPMQSMECNCCVASATSHWLLGTVATIEQRFYQKNILKSCHNQSETSTMKRDEGNLPPVYDILIHLSHSSTSEPPPSHRQTLPYSLHKDWESLF